ncbi:hypothetical protein BDF21DRAFT_468054 [Thamnidium elegans]|nr:hypothetical protein BDF21DRAFT_468054 [Thamnidium elegans]
MSDIPIYKYIPLPVLKVKITISFDDYEAYIKKEPEVHGVKWSESWSKYYQCHCAGTPRKRTRDEIENPTKKRPVQKE